MYKPPDYNLTNLYCTVHHLYSENDLKASVMDVAMLFSYYLHRVNKEEFNHLGKKRLHTSIISNRYNKHRGVITREDLKKKNY